jgi:iron complex transport system permease protein
VSVPVAAATIEAVTVDDRDRVVPPRPRDLTLRLVLLGVAAAGLAGLVALVTGSVRIAPTAILAALADRLPFVALDHGLTAVQSTILFEIRAPRVVLGLAVGALLAGSGAAYQGVFRNPLADPYLLGVAAGAGLGATLAIVTGTARLGAGFALPAAAFAGAILAVLATAGLSLRRGRPAGPASLILAGVAVAALLAAVQTYLLQRHADSLRVVYGWLLGRLSTVGWAEVRIVLPILAVSATVLVLSSGAIDVLAVGDEEATTLGIRPGPTRALVLAVASLATATAVSVSGLIGFVGLIVPHGVRLIAGTRHRRVIPLSMLFGAAFLALADLVARTVQAPAELPIGVITAFVGAPAFLLILRSQQGRA